MNKCEQIEIFPSPTMTMVDFNEIVKKRVSNVSFRELSGPHKGLCFPLDDLGDKYAILIEQRESREMQGKIFTHEIVHIRRGIKKGIVGKEDEERRVEEEAKRFYVWNTDSIILTFSKYK